MEQLYWLDRIQLSQATSVGEKALALAQLGQKNYPIVPGFVVTTSRLREFLEILGQLEPFLADLPDSSLYVDVDNREALQLLAQGVRKAIAKTELPQPWLAEILAAAQQFNAPTLIIRPSLTLPPDCNRNFAGLLRSQTCWCEPESLEFALKQVWAEIFRAGSLLVWQRAELLLENINLALLVQPLPNAIAAGTVNIQGEEAIVHSTWGLGHSGVRGEVQPDAYRIHLPSQQLKTRQLGNKTLAYRVQVERNPEEASIAKAGEEGLSVELLEEKHQHNYSLENAALTELIALTQRLKVDCPSMSYLEWIYLETPKGSQFYITQWSENSRMVSPLSIAFNSPLSPSPSPTPFLQGLSASPGQAVAPAFVIESSDLPLSRLNIPPGQILVAPAVTPEWLPAMTSAAGIIAEQGGITSHAAIIARELGIPAVIGVREATQQIQTGDALIVDGTMGEIYHPLDVNPSQSENLLTPTSQDFVPQVLPTPIATQLLLNLSQPASLEKAATLPVDGLGLLRSELTIVAMLESQPLHWWLKESQRAQFIERLTDRVLQFARSFTPRPVFYRSTDWRSLELSPHSAASSGPRNPILGRRGTFSYTLDSTLFEAELAALARIQAFGYTNIKLLLPFVRSVEEFLFCRDRVRQFGLHQNPGFQLWIMAEVPSVLFLLPEYADAGVQGISIGTNDLTQLLLGVDRERSELVPFLDERHPAILSAIQQLIEGAKALKIPCSICGQGPVLYPELIDRLVEWGITSISVEPQAVEQTYHAIARAEHRLILEAARRQ